MDHAEHWRFSDRNRVKVATSDGYGFYLYSKGKTGEFDRQIIDDYGKVYAEVYGATGEGEWGETWDAEEVSLKVREEMQDPRKRDILLIGMQESERLAGFAYGYNLSLDDFSDSEIAFSLHANEQAKSKIQQDIVGKLRAQGVDSVLYIKELGIRPGDRGGFDKVFHFFKAILEYGFDTNQKELLFWTSRKKRLFPLVTAFGAEVLAEVNDEEDNVYMRADIDTCVQIFQREPAQLAEMLLNKDRQH